MMKKEEVCWKKDEFVLRPAKIEDGEQYYEENFNPLDLEVAMLTGSKREFTKEEVLSFFEKSIEDESYYLFLLLDPDGRIIGESVINEIDSSVRSANFRICIFQAERRGKGIGTWMVEMTRDFAFETLQLHRLELNVFSFNPRAQRVYEKAGFHREGIRKDAVLHDEQYADDIWMAMLEEDWLANRRKEML